jgi:hypothetical protein
MGLLGFRGLLGLPLASLGSCASRGLLGLPWPPGPPELVFSKLLGSNRDRCATVSRITGPRANFLEAFGLPLEPARNPNEKQGQQRPFPRSVLAPVGAGTQP